MRCATSSGDSAPATRPPTASLMAAPSSGLVTWSRYPCAKVAARPSLQRSTAGSGRSIRASEPTHGREDAVVRRAAHCSTTPGSLVRYLRNSTASGGASRPTAIVVTTAEDVRRQAGAALDLGEGEPAERIADAFVRLAVRRLGAGGPLALQHHRRLAVAELAFLRVMGGGKEASLEGLQLDEPLELLPASHEAARRSSRRS